ncbi:MAG: hypothetical protein H0U78_01775 [Rickettsiaceae bacterium]|nr:hypothetical protein [Rickettsiaceae bacterium]
MAKDSEKPFEGFGKKIAAKSGGAHKPDPEGGIYKSEDGANTYLIKRDIKKLQNDVAEYMAAQIFDELCPGTACTITLQKSEATGKTFLASEFFQDNYRDLYRDLGKKGDRPVGLELVQDYLPKRAQYVRRGLAKKDPVTGEFVYQNYEKTTVASLLLADQSVHSGNIGVVDRNGTKQLVRIDFGAAFRTMGPEIDPVKSNMAHVVLEKNYFLRDHPKRRIFTKEFSAELKREAAIDLNPRIEKAWNEIIKNYDNEQEHGAIIEFGRQIGVSDSVLNLGDKAKQFPQIKDHFAKVMKQRQQSQKDMAFEIDVKLAFGKGKQDMDMDKLRAAIAENPKHAERILKNPSKTQSGIRLNKSQLKILQKELDAFKLSEIDIRKDVTKSRGYFDETVSLRPKAHQPIQVRTQVGLDEVGDAQRNPTKTLPESVKPERSLATRVEPMAQDRVMVSVNKVARKEPTISSGSRVSSSGGVDPITQAIRDEVLTKQQLYLQAEIAKTIPVGERNHFLDQDLSSFRTFVQSDVGKEKLSLAMKKPETEVHLKNIESNGYKEVHTQFQDSFKKMDWVSPPSSKVRFSEIKDPDGQHITSLKETTVQGATQVLLEDGSMRSIKSYRQIEFPKQIEGGNGPAHFSMAVKDENGHNVPEKGAVYFTAHYNDNGKLTEVSSPVPVKFMGKGDDAIGYIERGGKVYTLPVTQGKYKEMMKEVAVNKGMGANVSQSLEVEPMAQDKMTVKVNPKIAELAKNVGKKYKKEISEQQPKSPTTRPRSVGRESEGRVV